MLINFKIQKSISKVNILKLIDAFQNSECKVMIYYMSFGKLPSFQKSSTFLEKKYNRQPESKVVLIQLAGCRLGLTSHYR